MQVDTIFVVWFGQTCPNYTDKFALRARNVVVIDLHSETKGSWFASVLLAICRGELSAVIAQLMSE